MCVYMHWTGVEECVCVCVCKKRLAGCRIGGQEVGVGAGRRENKKRKEGGIQAATCIYYIWTCLLSTS